MRAIILEKFDANVAYYEVRMRMRDIFTTERVTYVGITGCPTWRWRLCDGHNASEANPDGMQSHESRGFRTMYPLFVAWGSATKCIERRLSMARKHAPFVQLLNSERYVTGPVKDTDSLFLYVCCK